MVILTSEKLFRFANKYMYEFGISNTGFTNAAICESRHDIYSYKRILQQYGQQSKTYIFANLFLSIDPIIFKEGAFFLSEEGNSRYNTFNSITPKSISDETRRTDFNFRDSITQIDKSFRPKIWNLWRQGEVSKHFICYLQTQYPDEFDAIPDVNPIIDIFKRVIVSANSTRIVSGILPRVNNSKLLQKI